MIEAGSTRGSRWLRERRLKVAVALALVEGALVVFDVIPATLALLVAAAVLVTYFGWARRRRSATLREGFWGPGGLAGARRARAARGARRRDAGAGRDRRRRSDRPRRAAGRPPQLDAYTRRPDTGV